MSYLNEFKLNWTNLLGAGLGLAFGAAINQFLMNLFGPVLIAEFGWTKSQFALVGAIGLIGMFVMPIAGRMTDVLGPRNAALIGFSAVPTSFLALSFMTGSIWQFYAILAVLSAFSALTANIVFTKVVIERFDKARGLALACLLSCGPLIGAIIAPIFNHIITVEGWRTAYRVMALQSTIGGIASVLLIGKFVDAAGNLRPPAPNLDWAQFRSFYRNPVFALLVAGMFLVNFPQVLAHSQLNLMIMENGATMSFATGMVSLYAISIVAGRFMSGLALDRMPPNIVAVLFLGLPTMGFLVLASPLDAHWALAASIASLGIAQGAEGDVAAIITSRRFDKGHYSFVFSLLMTSMGLATSVGSMLLSVLLANGGTFRPFLLVSAAVTVCGALCFFLTSSVGARYDRMQAEMT